jgi:hypothetical protein
MRTQHSASHEIPPPLYELEGPLPSSQDPATGPEPELDASSSHLHALFP